MDLTTSRLILRRWREADLSAFAQLNDEPFSDSQKSPAALLTRATKGATFVALR